MYYFPTDVWNIINEYLGANYWNNRIKLTYLSQVNDLITSDYINHSYWSWNKWRSKRCNNWYLEKRFLSKPVIPERFLKFEANPYIISIDPHKLSISYNDICKLHKRYREKIFNIS